MEYRGENRAPLLTVDAAIVFLLSVYFLQSSVQSVAHLMFFLFFLNFDFLCVLLIFLLHLTSYHISLFSLYKLIHL
jgi:hypothetical protein